MRLALVLSLLLLFPFSHALSCIDNATDIIFSEQGTLILGVLAFTMVIIAVAYILGSFTSNPSFTVFAKDEIYHLGFSVALLVGFSAILLFSCSAVDMFYKTTFENLGVTSICYDSGADMSDVSVCYLDGAKGDAERISEMYIDEYINYLMHSAFSVTISIPLMNSYTSAAGAWRRVVANQYDSVLNMFVFPALISLNMQELFLGFVSANIIKWLLPIALLLRIFIPTRQMGNMLIALSIGLYIIVPFIYTFNLAMYDLVGSGDCLEYSAAITDNYFGNCQDQGSFWDVARLIPQAFFLPNLTIALLITFLTGLNKALRVIG
ncbi:hypothetical protein H0O02_04455 [Candidatus Micrarchaeota archaeon]|nr:hypothetical protein [Candidatus Micrarchaeota archaeon]